MNKGKHEPENSNEFWVWCRTNCSRCKKYTFPLRPISSCQWELSFDEWIIFGENRPSDEIINNMFNLPYCSGFEDSNLQGTVK